MIKANIDISPERKLVMYLIINDRFCREVLPIIDVRYLKTRYAVIITEWVKEYYAKYEKAPGNQIQDIYSDRKGSLFSEDEKQAVAEFLVSLSKEHDVLIEDTNIEPRIDQAIKYLKTQSIEYLKNELERVIVSNDPVKGENLVANFKRVGRPEGDCYSIFDAPEDIIGAFMNEDEIALEFEGAVGQVVRPFYRGDLASFLGGPKKGKTSALLYAAEQALKAKKKCLYISLEMQKPKIIRKFYQSLCSAPLEDGPITVPFYYTVGDNQYGLDNKTIEKKAIDLLGIPKFQQSLRLMYRGGDCKFVSMPSYSTTVQDIEVVMDNLRYYEGYNTDVLIIDYADLLAAKEKEYRHKLNDIWANLKRISQERNILTLTASQTNRGGMGEKDLTSDDIAEDIRKAAHVSKLIALNQSKDEKKAGIMRWKILFERDIPFREDEVHTLQCLKLGKFCLDSRIRSEVV